MDLFLGDFIKHTTYEESQQSRHMVEEKETESLTVGHQILLLCHRYMPILWEHCSVILANSKSPDPVLTHRLHIHTQKNIIKHT